MVYENGCHALGNKDNKRKARAIINTYIEQYAYLEELPSEYNRDIY